MVAQVAKVALAEAENQKMASLAQYKLLSDEWANDPLGRGYAAMTDADLLTSLNTADRDNPDAVLDASQIYEEIDRTEWNALNNAQQSRIKNILDLVQQIPVGPGSKARSEFVSLFGGTSNTVQALAALPSVKIGRGTEIGWGEVRQRDLGRVRGERSAGKL